MTTRYDAVVATDPARLEPKLLRAIDEYKATEGGDWSIVNKSKSLRKFGKRTGVGTTAVTVGSFGGEDHETLATTDAITHLVSSSTADGETVNVEYHTISGGGTLLTFSTQTVVLSGQTAVALPTAAARVSRIYNISSTELQGDVYAYEGGGTTLGVPDDLTTVHAQIVAGQQQTRKLATSISDTDVYFITEVVSSVLNGANQEADFVLETRELSGVWLPRLEWSGAVSGLTTMVMDLVPVVTVSRNTDVRVTARMVAGTADVSGMFSGYLASFQP